MQDRDVEPRTRLGLLLLLVDMLDATGQVDQARQAVVAAARLADRNRGQVDEDIAALWLRAADLAAKAGDDRRREEALQAALNEQRDTGRPQAVIQQTVAQIEESRAKREVPTEAPLAPAAPAPEAMVQPAPSVAAPSRSADDGYRVVEVFYATDRAPTGSTDPVSAFGGNRSDRLHYGSAEVTIPETHKAGQLEAPSILKLEFEADPKKHVILRSVEKLEGDAFYGALNKRFTDDQTTEAFIFIHGFNQTFSQALRRTAQMAHDMEFEGVPIAYTWPSRGNLTSYIADTAVVRLSGRRLSRFLEDVAKRSGAERIHVIAHSMGNRALTDALELMALRTQPVEQPPFDQVVFAAPDVDAGLFAAMAETARPLARRMTLYASNNDWALEVSRKLHGNAPRAGQGGDATLSMADDTSIASPP
ncbi:MAG: alpha/beta fold hydrolase [Pseudomonadota bacterium]